ncbi:MAG: TRAP transporter small permease [Deltaproteobacteria bacterium]|nr:TRAP transporter small permease [Deltaproteobacteria bacterium]
MGKTTIGRLNRWENLADRGLAVAAAAIILAMMFLTTMDVVLRYIFNSPLPGVYELQEFMLVGAVFLGLAYIQSLKGHIYVDLFTNRFTERGQAVLAIVSHSVSLLIFALITWQGGLRAWTALITGQSREGLISYPLWPAKWTLTIGAGFFCLRLALDIVVDCYHLRNPQPKVTEKVS